MAAGLVSAGCESEGLSGEPDTAERFDAGTVADREALYDFLVEATMEWDAFASLPNHPYYKRHPKGLDVAEEMEEYREELLAADTDEKMWFVLHKISNIRKDRHLQVTPVEGGLVVPDSLQVELEAPLVFKVDYSDLNDRFFFIADRGIGIEEIVQNRTPELGDRLRSVNGRTVEEYIEAIRPYQRYSSENHFWWHVGAEITRTSSHLPHSDFYDSDLEGVKLGLETVGGEEYEIDLPYSDPSDIQWEGHAAREYPGFALVPGMDEFETFDLHRPDDPGLSMILLDWHGFRPDILEAVDALMEYAQTEGILDHHVIVDATRSRGGGRGSYAVQRLQSQPHRGTFGNLKVSEAMERWVDDRLEEFRTGEADPASVDDGSWKRDWLETDVRRAIEEGRRYTNDVPFKGAHLPRWADGIIDPAPVHFRGELTVWLGPRGGSHLDQFAAQVVDNDLGHVMGMSAGGFSNTWQATETLRFPTTGQPIVTYQWSLGHSIRPNREILQYNPAEVHEYVPQTRDNYFEYHAQLLERTLERLGL